MARLYANENYPYAVVEGLRQLGHDVVTTQELGNAGQSIPDEDVLSTAVQMQRAVITHNRRDFIRLHRQGQNHYGIVVCTPDTDFVGLANRVHKALTDLGEIRGQLIRVYRPQKT